MTSQAVYSVHGWSTGRSPPARQPKVFDLLVLRRYVRQVSEPGASGKVGTSIMRAGGIMRKRHPQRKAARSLAHWYQLQAASVAKDCFATLKTAPSAQRERARRSEQSLSRSIG